MPAAPETLFKRQVVAALRACSALTMKVHGHSMQAPGWPDLQVYHVRWSGHLELKVGSNRLSTIQSAIIRQLVERGAPAFCLRLVNPGSQRSEAYRLAHVDVEDHDGVQLRSLAFDEQHGARLLDSLHELSQEVWARVRVRPLVG